MRVLLLSVPLLLALPGVARGSEPVLTDLPAGDWADIRAAYASNQRSSRGRAGGQRLTAESIAQRAYLKASNTDAGDRFGSSVAVSGNTVLVGAPYEDSCATGVNGDQSDNGAANAGAAYVFVRSGHTWSQQAYLKASNADPGDLFGLSVALSGDVAVVGAQYEASIATGVNGDQSDDSRPATGAAYVFVRNGSTWTQEAYLKASIPYSGLFGSSVAVAGDVIVVGAPGEAIIEGAAYVFARTGTNWTGQARLTASGGLLPPRFGWSVAAAADTVLIGAPMWSPYFQSTTGAAFVYAKTGTSWSEQARLTASNADNLDWFGASVTVANDIAVVGAIYEDSGATGVNGNQGNWGNLESGAAYLFARSGTNWSQMAYLKASNTGRDDNFGYATAVSADHVLVGAWKEDSSATGVNGSQGNAASNSGAAYLFVRDGATWRQEAYIKASNTGRYDGFGLSVAISDDTMAVGSAFESSNASGIDGNQSDDSATDAGAAYVLAPCVLEYQASETIRLGWPPNPNALLPGRTTGPILGSIWDPVVEHEAFAPGAVVDFVGVDLVGQLNFPSPYGLVLITPPPNSQLFFAAPGSPFAIPIPNDCGLVGVSAYAQGGSFSAPGLDLANAIDIVFGTF